MARSTRARRQRDIASALHPSVEAASASTPPPSNPSDNREPNITGHGPDKIDGSQRRGPKTPEPQTYALVLGVQMLVPQTYDPDTYDPEGQMPWTPEPEPYDPETYAAWGRKHFGQDWYEQRKTMLRERNIYAPDPVYRSRQRVLRVLEHKIEGRPFEPGLRAGEMLDESWQRLWARLSKDLPSVENGSDPASPMPPNDSGSDLSGYNTYPPTPDPRESTPVPDDPWERLEWRRMHSHWDEERYQFERIFLKEGLIDKARREREDQEGDWRREAELGEIWKLRRTNSKDPEERWRVLDEYERRMRHYNLRRDGWTQEQIDATEKDPTEYKRQKRRNDLQQKGLTQEQIDAKEREGTLYQPATQEEIDTAERAERTIERMVAAAQRDGLPRFLFNPPRTQEESFRKQWTGVDFARHLGQHEARPERRSFAAAVAPATKSVRASQRHASPQPARDTRKTRNGRITKNAPQRRSSRHRTTQSRQSAPTSAEVLLPNRRRDPSKPHALDELSDNTRTTPQRRGRRHKTFEKERASRRLAGQSPEFGMLPGRGETQPLYQASLRQPSNTSKTSSSGPRSGRLSKKPTAAKGAKPQGISKSKQAGTGCPKRPAKGFRG